MMDEIELRQILDTMAHELISLVRDQTDFALSDRTRYNSPHGREVSGYLLRIFAGTDVIGGVTLTNKEIIISYGLTHAVMVPYCDPDLFDKIIEIIKT